MGLTDFSGQSSSCYPDFSLNFGSLSNGSYGIIFLPPQPVNTNNQSMNPMDYLRFTILYMMHLYCPNTSYLPAGQCVPCEQYMVGCYNCTNQTYCLSCLYEQHYYLLPDHTCAFCDNSLNYFIDTSTSPYSCVNCTLPYCVVCSSLT
jgi:hypothetical protein